MLELSVDIPLRQVHKVMRRESRGLKRQLEEEIDSKISNILPLQIMLRVVGEVAICRILGRLTETLAEDSREAINSMCNHRFLDL